MSRDNASKCKKVTELFDCSATARSSSRHVVLDVDQSTELPSKSVEDQVEVEPDEHPQAGHDKGQIAEVLVSGRQQGHKRVGYIYLGCHLPLF